MTGPNDKLPHVSPLIGIKPDEQYRRTLSDRMGAESVDLLRALLWCLVPTVAGMLIGGGLVAKRGLPAGTAAALGYLAIGALLGAIVFGGGSFLFVWRLSRGAGEAFGAFIQPKGEYQRDYSREDSLVARGDITGAIASLKKIGDSEPDNLEVRLRGAELHRKTSSFEEASALYREVQAKAVRPRDDVHASLRLIDLYLAWPEHEGRSMRELKRLIDKYPGTEIAKRSKSALASLKSERFPGEPA